MPSKKVTTQPEKVMDVASPGKGRIMTTSRPVIAPVVSVDDENTQTISEIKPTPSPSMTHKVIHPISAHEDASEATPDVTSDAPTEDTSEKAPEPVKIDVKPAPGKEAVVEEHIPVKKSTAETAPLPEPSPEAEASEMPEDQVSEVAEQPKPADQKDAPTKTDTDNTEKDDAGSDSAGVDELAKSVETKRDAVKKAEEAAQKQAELQKLIDSKQYFVPIGHNAAHKSGSNKSAAIVLLLLILLVAGAYLAADAGMIEAPFELPVDLIPN